MSSLSMHPSFKVWNPNLDFLRIASAILVVFEHYGVIPEDFIVDGVHGVCIFFIVSGYCMGFSMENRTVGQFAYARFSRLLPAFIFAVLLTSLIETAFPYASPERFQRWEISAANLVCLPLGNLPCDIGGLIANRSPFSFDFVDGAYWSLLVEFRFYALLAVLFFILKCSQRTIVLVLSVLGLLSVFQPFPDKIFSKTSDFLLYLPFFAFGIAYRLKDKWLMLAPILSLAVACAVGVQALSMAVNPGNAYGFALCFLIFVLVMNVKFKYSDSLKLAGAISYPLYLLHQDIGHVISGLSDMNPVVLNVLKIAGVLLLALLVHLCVERPAKRVALKIKTMLAKQTAF